MNNTAIRKYAFNVPSATGIEAKSLDFLWEKAPMTEKIHRAGFYHLIWVEKGKLSLMVDFKELRLQDNDTFLIAPGQVCSFNLQSRPQGFSVLFVPEFLGKPQAMPN